MTYGELQAALTVFKLGQRATLQEIKARHRDLAREHHPDRSGATDQEAMRRINAAYAVLTAYCGGYRYDFSEAEFLEQVPQERLRRQFSRDPIWGGERE